MLMARGKREGGLPPELRRAVNADKITRQRALRLIEEGGDATEEKIPDPDKPDTDRVALRMNEVVIDWLVRRKHITRSQWEAATMLRTDFEKSGLEQLRATDWTRPYVDGGLSKPEPIFREKHLAAFNRAIQALDPWTYAVVSDVVLRDKRPDECKASTFYSPGRDRKTEMVTHLRTGLGKLALHFGLAKDW